MRNIFTRLSQSFRGLGVAFVTIFAFSPALASANPALIDGVPAPIALQGPTLMLISPVDGESLPSSPAAAEDILAILRRGFKLEYEDNNRTDAERKWYVRHQDYLNRVFTRSQRYLPHILAELERRGLPLELALLPIVESAYDPFAYSHGRAAGLWQMIPGTARRFGIKQNWWYDGRRDIVDSTRAALDYLEYLEDINDGNWLNAARDQHVRAQAAGAGRDRRRSGEVRRHVADGAERGAIRGQRHRLAARSRTRGRTCRRRRRYDLRLQPGVQPLVDRSGRAAPARDAGRRRR
ncbi:MAG: transglycosylase SLT domain-containing protein [Woeseiaceae bacterium]